MLEGFPAGEQSAGFNIEDFIKNLLAKVGMNPQTVQSPSSGGTPPPAPADPRAGGKQMQEFGAAAGKLGGLAGKGVWDWLKTPPSAARSGSIEGAYQSYRGGERASYSGGIPKTEFWEWPT